MTFRLLRCWTTFFCWASFWTCFAWRWWAAWATWWAWTAWRTWWRWAAWAVVDVSRHDTAKGRIFHLDVSFLKCIWDDLVLEALVWFLLVQDDLFQLALIVFPVWFFRLTACHFDDVVRWTAWASNGDDVRHAVYILWQGSAQYSWWQCRACRCWVDSVFVFLIWLSGLFFCDTCKIRTVFLRLFKDWLGCIFRV